jgi:hypothetical protein
MIAAQPLTLKQRPKKSLLRLLPGLASRTQLPRAVEKTAVEKRATGI